ncbi:hypothetical protein IWX91DRAFT_198497 [Phyllosticta citricarpa]
MAWGCGGRRSQGTSGRKSDFNVAGSASAIIDKTLHLHFSRVIQPPRRPLFFSFFFFFFSYFPFCKTTTTLPVVRVHLVVMDSGRTRSLCRAAVHRSIRRLDDSTPRAPVGPVQNLWTCTLASPFASSKIGLALIRTHRLPVPRTLLISLV